jgi:hypothetical protein
MYIWVALAQLISGSCKFAFLLLSLTKDSQDWLDAAANFPNGVPRFNSKQEALDFMTEYNTYHGGSNPEFPHLQHIFTMLVNWEQIENILLPNIEKAREEPSFARKIPRDYLNDITSKDSDPTKTKSNNVYENPEASDVIKDINYRLDLPIHESTTVASTLNTLKYLFFHMKCGIYVMIRNGQLR